MTTDREHITPSPEPKPASLPLLADAPELLRVRILPAEFARLLGVSKQTVSRWIKDAKVTLNPLDGRLDVQTAVQQVLRNTDPGRLRARILRQAVGDVHHLRVTAALCDELNARLAEAHSQIAYLDGFARDIDRLAEEFKRLVAERETDMRATTNSAEWRALIEEIDHQAAMRCDADNTEESSHE